MCEYSTSLPGATLPDLGSGMAVTGERELRSIVWRRGWAMEIEKPSRIGKICSTRYVEADSLGLKQNRLLGRE